MEHLACPAIGKPKALSQKHPAGLAGHCLRLLSSKSYRSKVHHKHQPRTIFPAHLQLSIGVGGFRSIDAQDLSKAKSCAYPYILLKKHMHPHIQSHRVSYVVSNLLGQVLQQSGVLPHFVLVVNHVLDFQGLSKSRCLLFRLFFLITSLQDRPSSLHDAFKTSDMHSLDRPRQVGQVWRS
jgi:hypothetical protein